MGDYEKLIAIQLATLLATSRRALASKEGGNRYSQDNKTAESCKKCIVATAKG